MGNRCNWNLSSPGALNREGLTSARIRYTCTCMSHVGVNDKAEVEKRITVSEFSISGMTCQNCARRATQAIESVAGVESVAVDLAAGAATVRWLPGAPPAPDVVVETVRRTGFSAKLRGPSPAGVETRSRSPSDKWRMNIIIGLAAVVPLALGEWVLHLHGKAWFAWTSFLLALVVQGFCGARFYRGAWAQLKARSANMDTLVALGSSAAFGFSVYLLFSGLAGHLYFLESTAILTLISLGHWLEARATEQAASALKSLLKLSPSKARRLGANQSEDEVPIGSLRPGDIVVVRPGDNIPTDGVVLEGRATVDESMLTGEAVPVEKGPGAVVYGGTLNPDGRLIVRVTATGEHSALAKIIAAVKRAQNSRANIQRIGDRVSSIFVPVVVAVAIAAGLWWWSDYDSAISVARVLSRHLWPAAVPETALAAAFINAVAVLIVACPCAMGLATPAAIMAATNVAARRGFLVRDGVALEKAGKITTVVFDKTGTLTVGKPVVTAVKHLRPDISAREPIEVIAANLAAPSNHLVSRAIACLLNKNDSDSKTTHSEHQPATPPHATRQWTDWREMRGCGVMAAGDGHVWRLGALPWLQQEGIQSGAEPSNALDTVGETVIGLARDRELIGLFNVSDSPREEAKAVVMALKALGKRVCMVTGDQPGPAGAIAARIGIDPADVFAGVAPAQKSAMIRHLQQHGERVAFVGDGINDAPALEQADLGIAVGLATDVAREAADIVLLRSDLRAVLEALDLAAAALRTIKQNLFWAFFYNATAVPLAALGFLSPIICAATMGVSDLIVIGNALRLKMRKRFMSPQSVSVTKNGA